MTSDFFTKACLLIYESVTNFVASFPLQITKPIIWQLLFSQCKQPRLVKPWLNFDINVIFKSCGTPLVQVNRAFKSYFLSQSRQVLHESFLTSILEVPISPISKSMPLFSTATSFSKNFWTFSSGSTKWETKILSITGLVFQNYTLSYFYGLLNSLYLQYIFHSPVSFSHTCVYIPSTMVAGMDMEVMDPHFSWIRILPGMFF